MAGTSTYDAGTQMFSISGAGTEIGGVNDAFHFAASDTAGDFEVSTRLTSFSAANADARAGLMIRASASADSAFVGVFVTPGGTLHLLRRTSTGSYAIGSAGQTLAFPIHLKMSRQGSVTRTSYSADGTTWASLASVEISLPASVKVGLAANSKSSATVAQLRAECPVLTAGQSGVVLNGFTLFDVGNSAHGATASVSGDTYHVSGAGYVFSGTAREGLAFLARKQSGSAAASTYVAPALPGTPPARAGVMVRETLAETSVMASVSVDGSGRVIFEYRPSDGAFAVTRTFSDGGRHLLLDRRGSAVTAMVSSDGSTWRTLATASVGFGGSPYVGLYAISRSPSARVTAEFDGLDVVTP